MSEPMLKVRRLSPTARLPERGSPQAVGLDLFYDGPKIVLEAGQRRLLDTGIAVAIPEGCYGRIAPRSGLSVKGLDMCAGVIDRDYRGELKVLVRFSPSTDAEKDFICLEPGAKIAQLILERASYAEVAEVLDLDDTFRGDGGFGSTGD